MIVNVAGHGRINFPDSMSDEDVRAVLKQFEKKPDDTIPKLLKGIESLLKGQKPQIIKETEIKVVEVEKVIEKPVIKEIAVEKIVPVSSDPVSWHFTASKDDLGEWNVTAEPFNG